MDFLAFICLRGHFDMYLNQALIDMVPLDMMPLIYLVDMSKILFRNLSSVKLF